VQGQILQKKDLWQCNKLLYIGSNNPGFDMALFQKTSDGRRIIVAIETKYSDPNSNTTVSLDEINKTRNLWLWRNKPGSTSI